MSRPKGETVAEEDSYVMSGERKGSGWRGNKGKAKDMDVQ